MSGSEERYEIRESVTSEAVARRFPELAGVPHFTVWDTLFDKPVPFGGFATREQAQRRIDRLKGWNLAAGMP